MITISDLVSKDISYEEGLEVVACRWSPISGVQMGGGWWYPDSKRIYCGLYLELVKGHGLTPYDAIFVLNAADMTSVGEELANRG